MSDRDPRNWFRSDVERRLCRVLQFAIEAVRRLGDSGYTDPNDSRISFPPEKVVVEAALVAYVVSTVDLGDEISERLRALVEVLKPLSRGPHISLGMCLNPTRVWDYAQAHIYLTRMGHGDAGFDLLVRKCVSSPQAGLVERVPYRALEQFWLERLWHGSGLTVGHSIPKTTLHWPMNTLTASKDEVYAFTHALMYHSDFGLYPGRLPRARAHITEDAEASLARCLSDEDYDLAGEVLFSWPLTKMRWTSAAVLAFRVLTRLDDEYGYLPCSSKYKIRECDLATDEEKHRFIAVSYHTVFVMGILCALALRPGNMPPTLIPSRRSTSGEAARMLAYLDDGHRQDWQIEFDRCSPREQNSLAGMLMNMALWRKYRAQDFSGIYEILKAGSELGLNDAPMALQAAEALDRLAYLSLASS